MATINFNGTTSKVKAFDPNVDILNIDLLSAADVRLIENASGVVILDPSTGNTITLTGLTLGDLATSNLVFTDGSILKIGDGSPLGFDDFPNLLDLSGSTADNHAEGLGGNDTILLGDGNDFAKGGTGNDFIA